MQPDSEATNTSPPIQPPPPDVSAIPDERLPANSPARQKSSLISDLPDKPALVLLAIAVVAGIIGNIALRVDYTSISMWIATVLLAVGITLTRRKKSVTEYLLLGLSVLVATNYFLRDSALVVSLSVLSTGSLLGAVTYRPFGKTIEAWLINIGSALHDVLAGPTWFSQLLPQRSSESRIKVATVLRGAALAIATALPVVLLLASGDAVFASFLDGPDVSVPSSAVGHILLTLLLTLLVLGPLLSATRPTSELTEFPESRRSLTDFKVALSSLVVVLAVWSFSQVLVAAGGADAIFEAENLTRAQYARQGFFQLVAVAAIVIGILRYTAWRISQKQENDSSAGLVRVLAVVLAVLTLVLVGVSYSRLFLYIEAFDLTVTRLFVAWFLAWLAANLLFAIYRLFVAIKTPERSTSFSFALVAAAVLVTLLGWSNPEGFIADTNLDRSLEAADSEATELDENYLVLLSNDAAPVIAENFDTLSEPAQDQFCDQVTTREFGVFGYNRSVQNSIDAKNTVC